MPASSQSSSCGWSDSGTPRTRQIACDGSSRANARTKSTGSSPAASSRAAPRRCSSSASAATARGVKPRLTSARSRWCFGSSVWLSITPAVRSSLIAVPPRSRMPPRSDENVAASRSTVLTSAWRVTTQKPSPSGVRAVGSCQETGSWSRSQRNRSCGNPPRNVSSSDRSIGVASRHGSRGGRVSFGSVVPAARSTCSSVAWNAFPPSPSSTAAR